MPYYLQNCDCIDGLMTLKDETIHAVVTSPPWDDIFYYGSHSWDFERTAEHLARVLIPGGVICWEVRDQIVNQSISLTSCRQALYFGECGLWCHDIIVVDRLAQCYMAGRYSLPPTMVYVFSKGKPQAFNPLEDRQNDPKYVGLPYTRVIRERDGTKRKAHGAIVKPFGKRRGIWKYVDPLPRDYTAVHPCRMREELARDLIVSYSNPGNTILDPFAGVATTCKAALLNHRNYIGFEIHQPYFDIAQRRMQQAWNEYLAT